MKLLCKIVFSTLLCTSIVTAIETEEVNMERVILLLSADGDNNINPNGFIPFYWNTHLFAGVGYETGVSSDNLSSKSSFAPSKFNSRQSSKYLWLNLLSYQNRSGIFQYAIGGVLSYRKIDRDEFGYFNNSGTLVSLTNTLTIEQIRPGLFGDISTRHIGGILSLRLSGYLYPYSRFSAEQEIEMISSSLSPQIAYNTDHTSQDLSYRLAVDVHVKTGTIVDFSFNCRYEHLPLKYTMLTPLTTFPGAGFENTPVESEYTALRLDAKVLLPQLSFHGADPMLGMGYERVKNSMSLDITNAPEHSRQTYVVFGFEKLF